MLKLSESSRKLLEVSMRLSLLEKCIKSKKCTTEARKFIKEEATFEQLLNLVYNPLRKDRYLNASLLEVAAVLTSSKLLNFPMKENKKFDLPADYSNLESLVSKMRVFVPTTERKDFLTESIVKLNRSIGYKIPLNELTIGTASFFLFSKLVKEGSRKKIEESVIIEKAKKKVVESLQEAKKKCTCESCIEKYSVQIENWSKKLK